MSVENNGWLPIETAPRDRSIILLVDDVAIQGQWDDEVNVKGHRYGDGKWSYVALNSHGCGCCADDDPLPSGWMPLPGLAK